jgi:SAM-dependent methyltransferase
MNGGKTNKELAYLHELFVAPDWGERFAELIDQQVSLPPKGRVLYLGSNTGGHAISLQERGNHKVQFLCVDENKDSLEIAREKARTSNGHIVEFAEQRMDQLNLKDAEFDLVIGDISMIHSERVPKILSEMVRVATPGASVAIALPTFSSFGEFFSIYWEALHNRGLIDHETEVETLINVLPAVSVVEELAQRAGLDNVSSNTKIEEFDYETGDKFLDAPLIADFLMPIWLANLPAQAKDGVLAEIARLINEESRETSFALTVKATVLVGKKSRPTNN